MRFKNIGIVTYKNKKYCVLMNKRLNNYYVGIDINDNLYSLDLKEYLELKNYLFKVKMTSINYIRIGDTINLNPMIKIGKRLVPITLAMSLILSFSGCGRTKNSTISELSENGIVLSTIDKTNDVCLISSIDHNLIKENNGLGIKSEYFAFMDYETICTPVELNKYLNYGEISWNDIKEAINSNESIKKTIKDKLIKGIENLEKKGYAYDLTTLLYNLKNLKIDYYSSELVNGTGYAGIFTY